MAVHNCKNKTNARTFASKMRAKGFDASIYDKKRGYGVSVTRK